MEIISQSEHSPEFIAHIDEEVTRLSKECNALRKKLEDYGNGKNNIKTQVNQIDLITYELMSFEKNFNELSVRQKREYLKMLIEKVVWDGEKAHIFLSGNH